MAYFFQRSYWRDRYRGRTKDGYRVEEDNRGNLSYWEERTGTNYNEYTTTHEKLRMVLCSPAVLKVFALQCDLFSLGRLSVMQNGEELESDPLYNLTENPNPFQTQRQLLWDFMFWNMLGKAVGYSTTNNSINPTTKFYWLDISKIYIPNKLKDKMGKYIAGKDDFNELLDQEIEFVYSDRQRKKIKLSEVKVFTDLTNGLGNWFDGPSRIDALYKVISNSEYGLDAKNINLRFVGKFMVGGDKKANDMYADMMPMGKDEQRSVEEGINNNKEVTAVRSAIDIKRFVEDLGKLKLDEAQEHDYFTIGSMYNIPREILDIYIRDTNGISDSNKEKVIARHAGYSLQPKADDLSSGLCTFFGYDKDDKQLKITYDHLPFMQVIERDKAETQEIKANTLDTLIKAGANPEDAAAVLGLDLRFTSNNNNDGD